LHIADVHKLVDILQRLTENGNTVLVIEHNLDVIKTADYIIDLGPEGGDKGGNVVALGTPEEVATNPSSYTGQYLAPLLEKALHYGPRRESEIKKYNAVVEKDKLEIATSVKPRRKRTAREIKDK
jgi:excinuclease ABC subunit A